MSCKCISDNRPRPDQDVPPVLLEPPEWSHRDSAVAIDACIARIISALWSEGIWTHGSCCGHGDRSRRSVVVDRADRERAATLVRSMGDDAIILAWELMPGDRAPPLWPEPG